jgi:prophage antirepressor-like protein
MEQLAKVFTHERFGSVHVLVIDGKEMFAATQVATALGYSNPQKAIRDHCREDGCTIRSVIDSLGRSQQMKFISEGNVYRLVVRSKLPEADQVERWLFDEILPSMRKTGGAVINDALFMDTYLPFADAATRAMFAATLETVRKQTEHIAVIQPKADKYTEFLDAEGLTAFTTIGKHFLGGVDPEYLTKFLQGHGVLFAREVDKCYPPRKGYEQYFRIIPFYRGGKLLNKSVKATTAGIDFIVELYRKHDGKVPERSEKRTVTPEISVSVRKSA